jgi:anti-sigma regulatory factor (Ser/Thr protein kinase)
VTLPKKSGLFDLEQAVHDSLFINPLYLLIPESRPEERSMKIYFIDASSTPQTKRFHGLLENRLMKYGMLRPAAEEFAYAVMEAVENAREHGYNFRIGGMVMVTVTNTPDYDQVSVRSPGGSDIVDKLIASEKDKENLKHGHRGRGSTIMKLYSDVVHLDSDGTYFDIVLAKIKNKEQYEYLLN